MWAGYHRHQTKLENELMGLAVEVGRLADLLVNDDPEGAEWLRTSFAHANALLAASGLPAHVEPEIPIPESSRCQIEGYPYSFLRYLRRIYAHVSRDPGWTPREVPEGEDPTDDPVLEDESAEMESHLRCHSDAEGFYFPIDFEEVIFDDGNNLPGGMLGSTQRLMGELVTLAPCLGINLRDGALDDSEAERVNEQTEAEGPFWIEKIVWLSLFEAARLSLKYKSAICFT